MYNDLRLGRRANLVRASTPLTRIEADRRAAWSKLIGMRLSSGGRFIGVVNELISKVLEDGDALRVWHRCCGLRADAGALGEVDRLTRGLRLQCARAAARCGVGGGT